MGRYRKSDETMERIMHASKILFYEKGFQDTSIKDISEKSETNRALISYHFSGKEGLGIEISNQINLDILKAIDRNIRRVCKSCEPILEIAIQFRQFVDFRKKNKDYARFIAELARDNILVTARKHVGIQQLEELGKKYDLGLTKEDVQFIHHCFTAMTSGVILMQYDERFENISYKYIADKEIEIYMQMLGFDPDYIDKILKESSDLFNQFDITIARNFVVK
ncbi:MAG TPA: hypothetical protein DHN33_07085 [Eubacteriaceae bacterium]|nr:hypothetical protein [Eubacteriaceae bacterium]